jgi:hypothetical protein
VTQTSIARPATPVPVPASVARGRRRLTGSPGRLRVAAALTAVGCVLLGVAGLFAMTSRADALQDARAHAAQLVRVQQAAQALVRADAAVANGFLAGGAEPVALTDEYDVAIAQASRLLVDAAAAEPSDRTDLARANALLADYARQVANARSANRLGQPLGSGYLVLGSQTVLRGGILPLLDGVTTQNGTDVADAYGDSGVAAWYLAVGAVPCVAVLVGVQVWLARRTRRVVNLGLAAASLAVLAALAASATVFSSTGSTARDVRDTSYAATKALAQARNAAWSAKGLESLTLVKQGGGAAYEAQWKEQLKVVDAGLKAAATAGVTDTSAVTAGVDDWVTTHQTIRRLDDGGDWPAAVTLARRTDGADSSNVQFQAVIDAIDPLLAAQAQEATTRLGGSWGPLRTTGWAVLGLGLLAATAAVGGISQRLAEYR